MRIGNRHRAGWSGEINKRLARTRRRTHAREAHTHAVWPLLGGIDCMVIMYCITYTYRGIVHVAFAILDVS